MWWRSGCWSWRMRSDAGIWIGEQLFTTEDIKGIIRVFSKMLELFSVRCKWRWLTATTKGLFSQNCLTCKCQPFKVDPAASRYFCEQVASTLQISLYPHWLSIGWRLFNDWLRIQISTDLQNKRRPMGFQLHCDIFENLKTFFQNISNRYYMLLIPLKAGSTWFCLKCANNCHLP